MCKRDSSKPLGLALNLPSLCRLIAMFLSTMSSAPRAAQGEPAVKKSKNQDAQIDNLDCRLRQFEGDRVTFFLSAERSPGVVTQLKAAEDDYKNRAPKERPASPRPQQESSTGQRCELRFTLRGGIGRGGPPRQCPCSTTHTELDRTVERTQKQSCLTTRAPYRWKEWWEPAPSVQPNAIPANLSCHSVYCHTLLSTTSRHSCASHWKRQEGYRRQERLPKELCSNEVGQTRTKSCVWETHGKDARLLFSKSLKRCWSTCGCSCGCPSSSCPRGRRGGESSEPATLVRENAVGEIPQKTRGPRVCPPADSESVDHSQPSPPFEPRLDHTGDLYTA